MGRPYDEQVAAKQARERGLLPAGLTWLPSVAGPEEGFRNKAKMVVGGSVDAPTLGILDDEGRGVDLRRCGLYPQPITDALPALADFVTLARLTPYSVPRRTGELKYLLVTLAPSGDLMVRFVLRSTEAVARVRKHLPALRERLPRLVVASANIHPAHAATLEGDREIVLTEAQSLTMEVGGLPLHLRARSFFQTNTAVTAELYAQARAWVEQAAPASVWDLYCGVGGFALHCALPAGGAAGREVVGVELSDEAIASARLSAAEAGLDARFVVGDATAFALASDPSDAPDLVIVNPPRRGIGPALAAWLEESRVRSVVYSSCNAVSLARDLDAMPSLRPVAARVLDMFPQTTHDEVIALLERR